MRVLVAMSGGVDSSVAAALVREAGHEVVGATMKLWGGPSDSGCCSVADTEDARRVAQQLGVPHHVFNFTTDFDAAVVAPYVQAHQEGRTPNPCVECNRHLKFDRFARRARQLGFDAIATGHHARVGMVGGRWTLERGVDPAKDQSYVLHMLDQAVLSRLLLPVGEMTKADVRRIAARLGLRTAAKPDSQDVCFISRTGGREAFLGSRIPLRPGRVVDRSGADLGQVPAVELVTVGQRRGLGGELGGPAADRGAPAVSAGPTTKAERRYALAVDPARAVVTVGSLQDLLVGTIEVDNVRWVDRAVAAGRRVRVQMSAHGTPLWGVWQGDRVDLEQPARRVAPGQSVVLYDGDRVLGGGIAR